MNAEAARCYLCDSANLTLIADIKQKPKGKGVVEVSYNSLDELEGILAKIQ